MYSNGLGQLLSLQGFQTNPPTAQQCSGLQGQVDDLVDPFVIALSSKEAIESRHHSYIAMAPKRLAKKKFRTSHYLWSPPPGGPSSHLSNNRNNLPTLGMRATMMGVTLFFGCQSFGLLLLQVPRGPSKTTSGMLVRLQARECFPKPLRAQIYTYPCHPSCVVHYPVY